MLFPSVGNEAYGSSELTATLVFGGTRSPRFLDAGLSAKRRTLTSSRNLDVFENLACE